MLWLLSRVVVWPTKLLGLSGLLASRVTARTAVGSAKLGYRTGLLVGYRRIGLGLVGVAVGLLVAPVPGRELRARLWERLADPGEAAPGPLPPAGGPASASSNGSGAAAPSAPVASPAATSSATDPDQPGETGTNPAP